MIRLEACEIDLVRRTVHRDDGDRALTPQESELLEHLVSRAGKPVSRAELLRRVWGYPGRSAPETRAVDIAVRRLREKVERDPGKPRHVVTQRGAGYRFEPLDETEVSEEGAAVVHHVPELLGSVPPEREELVGRRAELEALDRAVGSARLVTVVGPTGVGKTRLVVRAATRWQREGRGVWVVPTAGTGTPAELVRRLAEGTGVPLDEGADAEALLARVTRVLKRRGAHLLVLDDLSPVAGGLVATLLERAPDLRVVITSRAALALEGAVRFDLAPLPADDALALLLARARARRAGWGEGAERVARQVVAELDGLPLAIELAAHRATVLTPSMLLEGLRDRFRLLAAAGGDPGASLRGALELSWSLLEPPLREAVAQLAVCRGFGLEAAAAVVALPDGAPWVLDWLQQLVDRCWVHAAPSASARARFALLESQRQFALATLADPAAVRARHRAFFLARGAEEVARLRGPEGPEASAALLEETDNLWEVWRTAREEAPEQVVPAALVLDAVLELGGSAEQRQALLDEAVRAARTTGDVGRTRLARAAVLQLRARVEEAAADLEVARGAAVEVGDRALLARVLNAEAALLAERGRRVEAAEVARRALGEATAVGETFERALAHGTLGQLAALARDLGVAEDHHRAMRVLAAEVGSWRLQLRARSHLATVARAEGRLADAEREYAAALRIARANGDRQREAALLDNLGGVDAVAGRTDAAIARFDASLELYRSLGSRAGELRAWTNGGLLRVGAGQAEEGVRRLSEALELAEAGDDPRQLGRIHGNLGVCLLQLDQGRSARRHLERAVDLLAGQGFALAYFSAHLAVAAADLDDGRAAAAALVRARAGLPSADAVASGLLEVASAHVALARGRAGDAAGRAEAEAGLAAAEEVARATDARPRGDLVAALLPSELQAAIRVLRRSMERTPGV